MYEEVYTIHRYDGHTFDMTLKEIFTEFRPYVFEKQFGYGTDFGRYISNYSWSGNYNFSFSAVDATLRVFYEYLYFVTNRNDKLVQPKQLLNEYYRKYDPTNRAFTGYYRWRISTGRKRRGRSCYRSIGTHPELRAAAGVVKEEGEPEFRGRRRNVPNAWDDIKVSNHRSWKECTKRRKQYKGS